MTEIPLVLTDEERAFLQELLERELKEKRVEVHRTDALTYRQYVQHEEDLVSGLLEKLRLLAAQPV